MPKWHPDLRLQRGWVKKPHAKKAVLGFLPDLDSVCKVLLINDLCRLVWFGMRAAIGTIVAPITDAKRVEDGTIEVRYLVESYKYRWRTKDMKNCSANNRVKEFFPQNWANLDSILNQVFGPQASLKGFRVSPTPASAWEDDEHYHVELDVPGVSREDIALTLEKGILQIDVERKNSLGDQRGYQDERYYGKSTRKLALPETIDTESIVAELANGVLHVKIAKIPEIQPKRIEIN